jgi:predicted nicotinamide N-methyase
MKAGAREVCCVDVDAFALAAIKVNAQANDVAVSALCEDVVGRDDGFDVVLAGDVSYERDMAQRVTAWLKQLALRGAVVRIGDPGRSYLARGELEALIDYQVPVTRTLEDAEIKRSTVWRFIGCA